MTGTTAVERHTDDWWAEAQAVAASDLFGRSPRLRALLLFLAERTITGQHSDLTEYEVGRQVFQKGTEWVPTDDSIVRSTVRQLRLKLADYYSQEGAGRPWRIEVPRGSYILSFRPGQPSDPAAAPEPSPAVLPVEPAPTAKRRSFLVPAVLALLCVSVALNAYLWSSATKAAAFRPGLAAALTLSHPHPTRIVVDDFAHVLLSQIAGYPRASVENYANREYISAGRQQTQDPAVLRLWDLLSTRQIVSLGAVATLDRLLRSTPDPSRMVMVHARNMTAREFRNGNSIIVGSEPNNPWSELFDGNLNFQRTSPGQGRVGFRNTNPKPGEEPMYSGGQNASINSGQSYARIAYLSNGADGFVLLLNGVNMVTTEAAGEFVADPSRLSEVCRLVGVSSADRLPHLEILLRTTAVDNSVHSTSIVAWRRLD